MDWLTFSSAVDLALALRFVTFLVSCLCSRLYTSEEVGPKCDRAAQRTIVSGIEALGGGSVSVNVMLKKLFTEREGPLAAIAGEGVASREQYFSTPRYRLYRIRPGLTSTIWSHEAAAPCQHLKLHA